MRVHRSHTAGRRLHRPPNGGRHNPILSNARNSYERYVALAKNAALSGDAIATENFYQHADHYFRQIREKQV